jgi:hypothetical protein
MFEVLVELWVGELHFEVETFLTHGPWWFADL